MHELYSAVGTRLIQEEDVVRMLFSLTLEGSARDCLRHHIKGKTYKSHGNNILFYFLVFYA